MTLPDIIIRSQSGADLEQLAALHEVAFGPGRFTRTAFRVREGAATEPRLNLCAMNGARMIGAIQYTPISIGAEPLALLLGPLVIAEAFKNQGFGLQLMLQSLHRAKALGYRFVILVGDLPYYARAGFAITPFEQVKMPGPVDPSRLLYLELEPGCLSRYAGAVKACPPVQDVKHLPGTRSGQEGTGQCQGRQSP